MVLKDMEINDQVIYPPGTLNIQHFMGILPVLVEIFQSGPKLIDQPS